MRRPAVFLAVWAGLGAWTCFAGSGATGFDFLNDPPGARSAGMGGTASSSADDAESSLWNPAAWTELRQRQLSLGYASFFDGMSQGSLAYGQPLAAGAFGVGIRNVDSGEIPAYTVNDARTGVYDAKDLALSLGYARAYGSWRWGINLKQVSQSIAGRSARTSAADAGILYRRGKWPVTFSAALRNAGGKASFLQEKVELPRSLDLGLSVRLLGEAFLGTLESRRGADGESLYALGAEVWLRNMLAVRAGWESGDRTGDGFSLGLGFKVAAMRLDYAFTPQGEGFSPTHRAGISWRFGGPGDRAYERGLNFLQSGLNAEAVLEFQKALDADPNHVRAIHAMREAVKRLQAEMREDPLPEEPSR